MNVLLTGGAGYIGTHTAVSLLERGHKVIIVDSLVNSSEEAVKRIEQISGKKVIFFKIDIRDRQSLEFVFEKCPIDAVVHLAGLKSIEDSVRNSLEYYDTNVSGTLVLLKTMEKHGVTNIVFSSSATVYGVPTELPIKETCQTGINLQTPYGWSKYFVERILTDFAAKNPLARVTILRYFNPIGAHPSGLLGESSTRELKNVMPNIARAALGIQETFFVFGFDYPTKDGTGVRDFIHVVDLADGHVLALEKATPGTEVYNLGTGSGTSVLELVDDFSAVSGRKVPLTFTERREGDIAVCYACVDKARQKLGWNPKLTTKDACQDYWKWQQKNPQGYQEQPCVWHGPKKARCQV